MAWLRKKTKRVRRLSVWVIGGCAIICFLVASFAEGKNAGSGRNHPFKILEIATSPSPFEVGIGELRLSIVVQLPKKLKGADLLEFTALISSPSRSSMRFLTQRIPLSVQPDPHTNSHVHATLFWDGRDQTQQLVGSGTYRYEVRAKLMAEEGDGPRTKMESPRSHGTVEVINKEAN